MNKLIKGILSAALRVVDSDGDGRIELSDLPGALVGLASMQAQGAALVTAAQGALSAFRAAADSRLLTVDGRVITAADVDAAWDKAATKFTQAADEARATLAKG